MSKACCVIEKYNKDGGDVGGEPLWSHQQRWVGVAGACTSGVAEVGGRGGEGTLLLLFMRIHQAEAWLRIENSENTGTTFSYRVG